MKYANPSIIEALCEISFEAESGWDQTVFGHFYDRICTDFPRRESGEVVETRINQGQNALEHQFKRSPRMRFANKAGDRVFQVGENTLVVNVLAPYRDWDEFRSLIRQGLEAYFAATTQATIARLQLRYIDQFETSESRALGEWFDCDGEYLPKVLQSLATDATYFIRIPVNGKDELTLSLGCPPTADQHSDFPILLDTMYTAKFEGTKGDGEIERVQGMLDQMHGEIVRVFERCLSDSTRQLLVPVRNDSQ
jgi:uncharacterized protein (TIGR04255 family)